MNEDRVGVPLPSAEAGCVQRPAQEDIANNGTRCVFFFCTLGWVLNMHSFLEDNSHSTCELVEQNVSGNLPRCTDYRPILRRVVLWQAHHHSCAVGHGKPRSRPLQFPDPFPMHPLGNSPPRKRSVPSAVQQRQPLSIIVHRKLLLLHFGATVFHEDWSLSSP